MRAHVSRRGTPVPVFRSPHAFITGLGIGQIVSWGSLIYSFPLLAEPMMTELGWSQTEVYLLASLALGCAGLTAVPVGTAIDRGHGRVVTRSAYGAINGVPSALVRALAPTLAALLWQ